MGTHNSRVEIELYEEIVESAKGFSTPSGSPVVN